MIVSCGLACVESNHGSNSFILWMTVKESKDIENLNFKGINQNLKYNFLKKNQENIGTELCREMNQAL